MILYAFSVYDLMRVIKDGPNVSGTRGYRVLNGLHTLFEDAVRGIGLTAIPHQLLSGAGSIRFPQSYKIADNIYSVPMVASQQNWGTSSSSSSFIRKVDYYEGAFHANIGIIFHSEHRNYTHNLFRVGVYTFTLVNIDGAATLNMNGIPVADISYSAPVYIYSLIEVIAGDQLEVYIDQKLVFTHPHNQELLIEDFELYFSTAGVWYSHFVLSDGREGGGRLGKVRVKTVPLTTKDGEFGDFYGTFDPDTIAVGANSLHRSNSEYVESGNLNTSEAYTSKIGDKIDASIDFDESLEVIAVQVSAIGRKEEPSQPDSTLVIGEAETRRMSGHLDNHTFVIPPIKEFSLEIGVHRERMLRPYEFARIPAENLDIYKFEVYDQRRAMLTNTVFSTSISFVDADEFVFEGGLPLTTQLSESDISFVEAPEYDYYNEIPMMHAALQASMQYVDASEYEKIEEEEEEENDGDWGTEPAEIVLQTSADGNYIQIERTFTHSSDEVDSILFLETAETSSSSPQYLSKIYEDGTYQKIQTPVPVSPCNACQITANFNERSLYAGRGGGRYVGLNWVNERINQMGTPNAPVGDAYGNGVELNSGIAYFNDRTFQETGLSGNLIGCILQRGGVGRVFLGGATSGWTTPNVPSQQYLYNKLHRILYTPAGAFQLDSLERNATKLSSIVPEFVSANAVWFGNICTASRSGSYDFYVHKGANDIDKVTRTSTAGIGTILMYRHGWLIGTPQLYPEKGFGFYYSKIKVPDKEFTSGTDASSYLDTVIEGLHKVKWVPLPDTFRLARNAMIGNSIVVAYSLSSPKEITLIKLK